MLISLVVVRQPDDRPFDAQCRVSWGEKDVLVGIEVDLRIHKRFLPLARLVRAQKHACGAIGSPETQDEFLDCKVFGPRAAQCQRTSSPVFVKLWRENGLDRDIAGGDLRVFQIAVAKEDVDVSIVFDSQIRPDHLVRCAKITRDFIVFATEIED